MGIGYDNLLGLLRMKKEGVDFSETATLGRHALFLTPKEMKKAFKNFDYQINEAQVENIFSNPGKGAGYQETLLEWLGAKHITSFDISNYENCSVVHDFNDPIPQKFHQAFSCVLDFGSSEHIFNYPQTINNLINLCKIQGNIIIDTPHNNCSGHGLYQFSPELFIPLFSEVNGCEIEKMFIRFVKKDLTSFKWKSRWYEVIFDLQRPDRIEFCYKYPSLLFVCVKKIAICSNLSIREKFHHSKHITATIPAKKPKQSVFAKIKRLRILVPVKLAYYQIKKLFLKQRTFGLSHKFFKKVNIYQI